MNKLGDVISDIYSDKAASYIGSLSAYRLVCIFFIGCFLGYIIETIYCYPKGGFQSRQAVLYGPFVPVYGFGGLLLTLALYKLQHMNVLLLFIISAVLGASFEYIYSLLQELMLGAITWDYSKAPFNLQGRTSLLYGVYWGVLGVLWIKLGYPLLSRFIERIPIVMRPYLTSILIVFMALNLILSALAIKRGGDRLQNIPPEGSFNRFLDSYYNDEYLARVFPYLKYIR